MIYEKIAQPQSGVQLHIQARKLGELSFNSIPTWSIARLLENTSLFSVFAPPPQVIYTCITTENWPDKILLCVIYITVQ